MTPVLLARLERDAQGTLRILSPEVGIWHDPPARGALLGPGSAIGHLERLNRRATLVLPEGAAGSVRKAPAERALAVEYGSVLLELSPLGAQLGELGASAAASAGATLEAGSFAVVSPTDGTFYRRLAPGAAAFVEVGSSVRQGQAVGLVEVMKTFNQVLYGGPGLPEEAQVVELRCDDAQEVRAGQVLVVVRAR